MSRAKRATDEVLASRDRVAQHAKAITKSLTDRDERAHTDPFIRIERLTNDERL